MKSGRLAFQILGDLPRSRMPRARIGTSRAARRRKAAPEDPLIAGLRPEVRLRELATRCAAAEAYRFIRIATRRPESARLAADRAPLPSRDDHRRHAVPDQVRDRACLGHEAVDSDEEREACDRQRGSGRAAVAGERDESSPVTAAAPFDVNMRTPRSIR